MPQLHDGAVGARSLLDSLVSPVATGPGVGQSPLPSQPLAAAPAPDGEDVASAPAILNAHAPAEVAKPSGSAQARPTIVRTPQQLQQACRSGQRDIELRQHVDLRELARQVNLARYNNPFEALSARQLNFSLLYTGQQTRSIRVRAHAVNLMRPKHANTCVQLSSKRQVCVGG